MAKRAALSLTDLKSQRDITGSSSNHEEKSVTVKRGRPQKIPADFKTMTVRVSPDIQRALRQASLNHDRPIQQIITDGILDQLSRLGLIIEEK